ncbi:ZIP metal ion transporter, putative [Cordyceps militaris CM01]|uniref:ZIP metal ion transporter, putative n=1 Tax=Cordyceps militaris (strain CM01) TaxID=983644 RepID=G3J5M3_CORMM|nr:ZIP metal ion transporter, putative [Cordyceps militaris CM01]EGX96879.1 ZIP metal ion transporter, putative [Cordyceps militaris CM01]
MASTTGLDNDVRGWILCFISGIACIFGASVVCVDILIRLLPGKSTFRIQESNAFLACSLSLSFGVMMFSSLYVMLPEAREYLRGEHWNDQKAALLIMGCFIGGFIGIQAVSRFLHQHMPSHVVDCDHTHKDSSPFDDEDGQRSHSNGHNHGHSHSQPHHGETHNSASSALSHSRRSRLPSPHAQAHPHVQTSNGFAHDQAIETTPLLPTSKYATVPFRGRGRAMTEDVDAPRRPSMLEVQKRVMSFVKDTKSSCDEEGSCYGYSDPCGQECFKHISYRAVKASRSQTRLRTTMGAIHPPHISTNLDPDHDYAESLVSPMYRTSRATSRDAVLRPPVESVHEDDEGHPSIADGRDHVSEAGHNYASCAASHAEDTEAPQHHHHVPTNAFLSIGLQTSIAITLHKLPEGFITYATNHANPELGFNVFMALFVHNITEGFTMCLPLYMALGSRWKAMAWSALLGGLSQPFGAGIAALWFKLANRTNMQPNAVAYACLFAATSGIMVSVALQLFVEGLSLNHNRNLCMFFGFLGMAVLGLSNALFAGH